MTKQLFGNFFMLIGLICFLPAIHAIYKEKYDEEALDPLCASCLLTSIASFFKKPPRVERIFIKQYNEEGLMLGSVWMIIGAMRVCYGVFLLHRRNHLASLNIIMGLIFCVMGYGITLPLDTDKPLGFGIGVSENDFISGR